MKRRVNDLLETATSLKGRVLNRLKKLSAKTKPFRSPKEALEQWLSQLSDLPPVKGRVLIAAMRNETWIEWSVYCACVIRKMGYQSTLIYQRQEVEKFYPQKKADNFWERVRSIPDIELFDLNDAPGTPEVEGWLRERANKSIFWELAYDLHLEEDDIRQNLEKYREEIKRREDKAVVLGSAFHQFLKTRKFDRFFCYSGLIGYSPTLLDVARLHNLETYCLEGWAWRPGHMIYNKNAPALEYNIKGWLDGLGAWDEVKNKELSDYQGFQEGNKVTDTDWLNNFYSVQRTKASEKMSPELRTFLQGDEPVFVLAPNVVGDSSTLCRETIFSSQREWIEKVVQYFKEHGQLKLIVRAHPAEEWVKSKIKIKLGQIASNAAKGASNILVIHGTEKVNTFSLLPFTRGGLVWMSSVGVDMVARGVPVIAAARPKYENMGIVEEPKSLPDFYEAINRLAKGVERPSAEQVLQAKRYLHLVFKGFSFEANGRNYRATECRLGQMPSQAEHDRFYRILTGEEVAPDQS